MSDLVERLRAQAETLRESARDRRFISAPDEIADWYDSLADLIDGTLQEHRHDGPDGCNTCSELWPCESLRLLARHVSSVIGEVTA